MYKGFRNALRRVLALGVLAVANPLFAAGTLVEYHNTTLNHYFLTIDPAESGAIDSGAAGTGWQRTGKTINVHESATVAPAGAVPVCRFYGNPAKGGPNGHFYTADAAECAAVKLDAGWTFERNEFQALLPVGGKCAAPGQDVYRVYNKRAAQRDSNHRYTTEIGIYDQMVAQGWAGEGVVFCAASASAPFTISQTLSDEAQRTTLAFSGLAMMTGNLNAQSFFPPGKVADYTGFQYLRDNDPDNMGHNTSFLTRVANNVIYVLDDSQMARLKALATGQLDQINLYGYQRYALMKAFRRQMEGDIPASSAGLNLASVKQVSRALYRLDGQISFDRAQAYAELLRSMNATQKAHLDAMKGKGWNSWPAITDDQVRSKMTGLPQGTAVAVMTYASDLFSWYAGSLEADVYFCPERHGTYFGSFYIKDAPAIGHEGYGIDEQLTATAGAALSDSTKGYVTPAQAALISSLVDRQRDNLYASTGYSIVKSRTAIASLLRGLLASSAAADTVRTQVLALSELYGELDGANNHAYATVFAQVYKSLSAAQTAQLAALRKSIMSGTYADGTPFDYSVSTTPFLYSEVITNPAVLAPYVADTDYLFFEP